MPESAAVYISVLFPQHGYLGLLKQIRKSQEIQIQQYPQRAWHYEDSKFYMLQAFFMHAHTNGIIWVQLSADVLPLTPIFLTHYKQIILLTHPVKQTELSIICILLLFKLPNKHFSGFMDGRHLQDSSSGGTSGGGRTLSAGILWFCCVIHCCVFGKREKSPVARSNGSCSGLGGWDGTWAMGGRSSVGQAAAPHCLTLGPGCSWRYQVGRKHLKVTVYRFCEQKPSNFVQNPGLPRTEPPNKKH